MVDHRAPALTLLMLAVTLAHAPVPLCAYSSGLGVLFYRRRQPRWLAALALAVPVGLAINAMLKHAFQRARPVPRDALLALESFSFPSGHTAGATLFYGIVAAYFISRTGDRRVRARWVAVWIAAIALVALSRVYLGVHYVSDVLGAVAWSLAWLAASLLIASRIEGARRG